MRSRIQVWLVVIWHPTKWLLVVALMGAIGIYDTVVAQFVSRDDQESLPLVVEVADVVPTWAWVLGLMVAILVGVFEQSYRKINALTKERDMLVRLPNFDLSVRSEPRTEWSPNGLSFSVYPKVGFQNKGGDAYYVHWDVGMFSAKYPDRYQLQRWDDTQLVVGDTERSFPETPPVNVQVKQKLPQNRVINDIRLIFYWRVTYKLESVIGAQDYYKDWVLAYPINAEEYAAPRMSELKMFMEIVGKEYANSPALPVSSVFERQDFVRLDPRESQMSDLNR